MYKPKNAGSKKKSNTGKSGGRPDLSPEARARIGAAQRKRWANDPRRQAKLAALAAAAGSEAQAPGNGGSANPAGSVETQAPQTPAAPAPNVGTQSPAQPKYDPMIFVDQQGDSATTKQLRRQLSAAVEARNAYEEMVQGLTVALNASVKGDVAKVRFDRASKADPQQ